MGSIGKEVSALQLQSQYHNTNSDSLLRAIRQGYKDATIIKILTQIATLFHPASLIAVRLLTLCVPHVLILPSLFLVRR